MIFFMVSSKGLAAKIMQCTRLEKATLVPMRGPLDRGAIPQGALYSPAIAWSFVALANYDVAA